MKKIIKLIWPRLEGEPSKYQDRLSDTTEISSENVDASLEFAKLMYQLQKERVATIESKSSVFVAFFGAVIAVLAFLLKDVVMSESYGELGSLLLLGGAVMIIYILQVMRYSIKAMERQSYHSLDEADFLNISKSESVIKIINKVKSNYDVINEKVDHMTMAQEFVKRLLCIVTIIAVLMAVYALCKMSAIGYYSSFIVLLDNLSINRGDVFFVVLFLGVVINFFRISRLSKKIDAQK